MVMVMVMWMMRMQWRRKNEVVWWWGQPMVLKEIVLKRKRVTCPHDVRSSTPKTKLLVLKVTVRAPKPSSMEDHQCWQSHLPTGVRTYHSARKMRSVVPPLKVAMTATSPYLMH
jgi:hypothetical protein